MKKIGTIISFVFLTTSIFGQQYLSPAVKDSVSKHTGNTTVSENGIGYGSGNRAYVNIPDVNISENGVVYVEVHVTEQGNVINARILNTKKYPTNITNPKIQQDCLARALSAKYIAGKEELRVIVFR